MIRGVLIMKKRVVITGMGVISPCGNNTETFWQNISNGRSGIKKVTKFDASDFACKIGGEVNNLNPEEYGISKKEAKRIDLFSQYALAAASLAIKDSGLKLKDNNEDIGVIIGTGVGGFNTIEEQENILFQKGAKRVSPFTIPNLMPNAASGEVSIKYGIMGPSLSISSACASGLHSIIYSVMTIKSGIAKIMVTGGSEAAISPLPYAAFSKMGAITAEYNESPEKASRPFDAKRSGFVMSEGAGIIVIESLENAVKRNAGIYAEIIGYGMSSDAYHITAPEKDGKGASLAIANALKSAEVDAKDIDYINAHGTSTPLNDLIETRAIKNVFKDNAYNVPISSSKSMLGHTLGAAGGIETIVCALAIKEGIVPPTINYENPDPECDLDYVPNIARKSNVNIAMNNNLGFGGHNACLVLKKYE